MSGEKRKPSMPPHLFPRLRNPTSRLKILSAKQKLSVRSRDTKITLPVPDWEKDSAKDTK